MYPTLLKGGEAVQQKRPQVGDERSLGTANGNRTQNSRAMGPSKGIERRTSCAIGTGAPPGRGPTARIRSLVRISGGPLRRGQFALKTNAYSGRWAVRELTWSHLDLVSLTREAHPLHDTHTCIKAHTRMVRNNALLPTHLELLVLEYEQPS